ncbi:MAG: EamA family transporter, partial [Campylobacteraceae bacterium]|nr:EamA family transporter [Campylobacteraceae bacterium]MBT5323451.1 EamA family transporter [Campylobacteraceae bacterium]
TATIFLIPFIFILPNNSNGEILSLSFLSIVYLAIIPTATASLLRIKLVQKIGVQFMSQVAYLIPIFAIFWSWIIFNQTPEYILIVALLFIFSGLFIRNIK